MEMDFSSINYRALCRRTRLGQDFFFLLFLLHLLFCHLNLALNAKELMFQTSARRKKRTTFFHIKGIQKENPFEIGIQKRRTLFVYPLAFQLDGWLAGWSQSSLSVVMQRGFPIDFPYPYCDSLSIVNFLWNGKELRSFLALIKDIQKSTQWDFQFVIF